MGYSAYAVAYTVAYAVAYAIAYAVGCSCSCLGFCLGFLYVKHWLLSYVNSLAGSLGLKAFQSCLTHEYIPCK